MGSLLSRISGTGELARHAQGFQARSDAQERAANAGEQPSFADPPGSVGGPSSANIPGISIDPIKTAKQISPILEFRDEVVKAIAVTTENFSGLEALVEKFKDNLTFFVF